MRKLLLLFNILLFTASIGFAQESKDIEGYVGENNDLSQRSLDLEQRVEVYPNPAIDFINFKINSTVIKAEVWLTDLRGKIILNQIINDGEGIDLTSFKHGIYLLLLKADGKINITKIEKR